MKNSLIDRTNSKSAAIEKIWCGRLRIVKKGIRGRGREGGREEEVYQSLNLREKRFTESKTIVVQREREREEGIGDQFWSK